MPYLALVRVNVGGDRMPRVFEGGGGTSRRILEDPGEKDGTGPGTPFN